MAKSVSEHFFEHWNLQSAKKVGNKKMRLRNTCPEARGKHRVNTLSGNTYISCMTDGAALRANQPTQETHHVPRFLPRRGGQIGGHDGGHDRGTTFEDSHAVHVLRGTTWGTTFCPKLKFLTPPTFYGARHPTEWIIYNTTGVQGCDTMTHTHTQTVCHKCLSRFLPSQKRNAQVHVFELETELPAK